MVTCVCTRMLCLSPRRWNIYGAYRLVRQRPNLHCIWWRLASRPSLCAARVCAEQCNWDPIFAGQESVACGPSTAGRGLTRNTSRTRTRTRTRTCTRTQLNETKRNLCVCLLRFLAHGSPKQRMKDLRRREFIFLSSTMFFENSAQRHVFFSSLTRHLQLRVLHVPIVVSIGDLSARKTIAKPFCAGFVKNTTSPRTS